MGHAANKQGLKKELTVVEIPHISTDLKSD